MNYFKIDEFDSADGLGIRVGLYVSGCTHKCKGCHSSMYWPFDSGKLFTDKTMEELKNALSKDYIEGLSILGGDPLEKENIHTVKEMIKELTNWYWYKYGKMLNIWLWTGSVFENLCLLFIENVKTSDAFQYINDLQYIFNSIDVLVDGPFIEEKKDLNLAFRGSSNQRLIDMKKTLETKKVTLLNIKENIHEL